MRTKSIDPGKFKIWLSEIENKKNLSGYEYRRWRENRDALDGLMPALRESITEAHDDARKKLRDALEDPLSPIGSPTTALDPALNYPHLLHKVTLKGYFGETLGVLLVESIGAFGHTDWEAPLMLFRMHGLEIQHLNEIEQVLQSTRTYNPDAPKEQKAGRPGDDAIAFRRTPEGKIIEIITFEGKCLGRHSRKKLDEAHAKVTKSPHCPSSIFELIDILRDYKGDADAEVWRRGLLDFRNNSHQATHRHSVLYACGDLPAKETTRRIDSDTPHTTYVSKRALTAMEVQLGDLNKLIDLLYRGAE